MSGAVSEIDQGAGQRLLLVAGRLRRVKCEVVNRTGGVPPLTIRLHP